MYVFCISDYVFSTAHKAKGLEFSTVKVTDDFLGESRFTIDLGPDMALNVQIPGILSKLFYSSMA